ncbi:hypothetical protein F5Y16DRAFT_383381 [Xylariaceae sp. FL0255]|nr:hypothetical protein F5Y16DRAFT_383381 [Xylariaceae sp. FL0255]
MSQLSYLCCKGCPPHLRNMRRWAVDHGVALGRWVAALCLLVFFGKLFEYHRPINYMQRGRECLLLVAHNHLRFCATMARGGREKRPRNGAVPCPSPVRRLATTWAHGFSLFSVHARRLRLKTERGFLSYQQGQTGTSINVGERPIACLDEGKGADRPAG